MSFDLNLSDEQRQILDATQSLLDDHYQLSRLRESPAQDDMAPIADFGGFALALPEHLNGTGLSVVVEALVHVRFGRHLLSPATLAAPLAARICAHAGQPERGRQLAAGAARACVGMARKGDVLLIDADAAGQALVWDGPDLLLAPVEAGAGHRLAALGHGRPLVAVRHPSEDVRVSAPDDVVLLAELLVSA